MGVPWARLVGKKGAAEAQGIAVDGSDNVYVVGQFKEVVDCGGGDLYASGYRDIFVAKYTSAGQHVWSKHFGSLLGDTHYGHVAAGPEGDLYLALNLMGPVDFGVGAQGAPGGGIVVKLDTNGDFVWSDAPSRRSLTPLPGGELLTSAIENTGCPDDASLGSWADKQAACVVLERRDAAGNLTWQKRYPGFVDQPLYSTGNTVRPAARDGAGNILLGGNLAGGLNFGAPMTVPGPSETDVYAAVVDASGAPVWSRHIAPGPEIFPALVLPADTADLLLLGNEYDEFAWPFDLGLGPLGQTGTRDSWIARFDSAGNTQWARAFVPIDGTQPQGYAALVEMRSLVQRAPNDYVGVGAMTASADLGAGTMTIFDRADIFVLTLDGAGTTTSSRMIPGADTQDVVGAAALSNGLVAVSGITLGSIDFGQGALVPQVYWDTYVAVIDP